MKIESADDFKTWLVKELEPVCDADPAALAKYVMALVKKDKPETDLKALCEDQLDVFLGEETKPFVFKLFAALEDRSYIQPPKIPPATVEEPAKETEQKGTKRKSFEEYPQAEGEKLVKTDKETDTSTAKPPDDKENIENGEKTENQTTDSTLESLAPVDKTDDARMRSVSVDRSVRSSRSRRSSRSPNRSNRHSRHTASRSSRNEKPRDSRGSRDSRRTKRREPTRERCRDYEEKGYCMLGETCRFDHGRDPLEVDDRNLPQMLSLAASTFPPSTQPSSNAKIPNPAMTVFQNVNLLPGQRPMVPPLGANLSTSLTTVQMQNTRPSPVEMAPQVPIFRPRNPMALFRNISPSGIPPPPLPGQPPVMPSQPPQPSKVPPVSTAGGDSYNPEQPSINEKNEVATETKARSEEVNHSQDELVQIAMGNVPLTPILGQPAFAINGVHNMSFPDLIQHQQIIRPPVVIESQVLNVAGKKPPYHGGKNTALEIRKIPAELNNMFKLSEHFQRFGNITKLQSPFDADPFGALIEFSTNREAFAAYSSPEAILGNRFIKMFWHKPKNKDNKDKNAMDAKTTGAFTSNESKSTVPQEPKKVPKASELYFRNPKTDPRLIQMEKKKELEKLVQLKMELSKKKQQSYEDLVQKQKQILTRLQEKGLLQDEKTKLMKTFKTCDTAVKKLKTELEEETEMTRAAQSLHHAKPYKNTKKDILDKEIDIIHGNLQGEELLEAQKELEMMKEEITHGGSRGARGGYRGRARGRGYWRGRGRGRGGILKTTSVDNRPKKILVAGYTSEEKDNVLAHFNTFSHLEQIVEVSTEKMVISFPNRKSAEIAAQQGTDFNGKKLQLSWFSGETKVEASPQVKVEQRVTRSLSQSLMEKELEDELLEDIDDEEEDVLLAGVEDDDEESETLDRSWKR